jgi:hypothetical protein
VRLSVPQPREWQHVTDRINAAFIFAQADFVKVHCEKFQAIALFRRHQNNAHKLKHCGGKLENDYGEEWRERAENGGIVQLQYRHRGPKSAEQIKHEACSTPVALRSVQMEATGDRRARSRE